MRVRASKSGVRDVKREREEDARARKGALSTRDAPMHHLRSLLHPRNARAYTHPCPEGPVTFRRIYNLNPITPRKDGPLRRPSVRPLARTCRATRSWKEAHGRNFIRRDIKATRNYARFGLGLHALPFPPRYVCEMRGNNSATGQRNRVLSAKYRSRSSLIFARNLDEKKKRKKRLVNAAHN